MPDRIPLNVLEESFPRGGKFQAPWRSQEQMMGFLADHPRAAIQSPTGSGKTPVMYAFLKASERLFPDRPLFWVEPNKTLVQQVQADFPDVKVAFGRHEHPCLFYATRGTEGVIAFQEVLALRDDPDNPRADEIPCSALRSCPHRVNQETGDTHVPGAFPCPYLRQKFEAKQGGIVVCTVSWYLLNQVFNKSLGELVALVVDEAHQLAEIVRATLSYDITDHHLEQSIELLERIGAAEAEAFKKFLRALKRIAKGRRPRRKPADEPFLLESEEIRVLIEILQEIDPGALEGKIQDAVDTGVIDVVEDRVALTKLLVIVRDVRRYLRAFEFSLEEEDEDGGRKPLTYTCSYYRSEKKPGQKVEHKLVIKSYYVRPLVRKRLLAPFTAAFSATIGKPAIFGFETGIEEPDFSFLSLDSNFPAGNTRLYVPTDTPHLAMRKQKKRGTSQALRLIATAARRFAQKGCRSLVVVVSNKERESFLRIASEEGVDVLSYGNGVAARDIAQRFKNGEGAVLCGTTAHYAQGLDLPKGTASIIFFLRPGYVNPRDPEAQFEMRRFSQGQCWALWMWRVMIEALQVRGRNVRNRSDLGVCFFVSQQFRNLVWPAIEDMPWLVPAYRGEWRWEQCLRDVGELLS